MVTHSNITTQFAKDKHELQVNYKQIKQQQCSTVEYEFPSDSIKLIHEGYILPKNREKKGILCNNQNAVGIRQLMKKAIGL